MITIPNDILFEEVVACVNRHESVTILLKGNSMRPLLKSGVSKVKLSPIDRALRVGDVVLFRCCGRWLLHRIVKIEGEVITIQGDNCYSCEVVRREDVKALMTSVKNGDKVWECDSKKWKRLSRWAMVWKWGKKMVSRPMRKRLRVWYFVLLAFLMWAPLNGLAAQFPNYVLGLRFDHFVHASVFILCALFWVDLVRPRKGWVIWLWLLCAATGIVTESVQYLLPYRGYDINDLLANFIGSTIGWLMVIFAIKICNIRKKL